MIDEKQIRQWWSLFRPNNELAEIRLLGAGTMSGYFTDVETLLQHLRNYANHPKFSVYFVLNEIKRGCYYKNQRDKLDRVSEGETTNDNEIASRKWLLIDIDPARYVDGMEVKGINSTDEELGESRKAARQVYDYLKGKGFPEPLTAMSGNGTHLYFRINEPNDKETTTLIKTFLLSLAQKFSTSKADVDKGVWTAARLSKLYGTVPHKGADTPERPCRMAVIDHVPKEMRVVSRELIKSVADEYDDPKLREAELRQQRRQMGLSTDIGDIPDIDLQDFLDKHGICYKGPTYDSVRGAMKFILDECPWCHEHTTKDGAKDAALFEWPSGHKDFNCFHGHCATRGWSDFWRLYDPDLYKNAWKEQHTNSLPNHQTQPLPVLSTTPSANIQVENGSDTQPASVWLRLSEIQDVNIDDLERVYTSFSEIDTLMHGLFMGELTILSGLPSSGKSSWLNTLMLNVVQNGYKVALWTGELQGFKIRNWLLSCAAGNRVVESTKTPGTWYVPNSIKEHILKWLDERMVIFNNDYTPEWGAMYEQVRKIIEAGYRFVVLDNLFALDIDKIIGDQNERQKKFILTLSDMAKKNNVHIILVAHPRKVVTFLRREDILGSSALLNAVDNILIMHRTGNDFERRAGDFFKPQMVAQYTKYGNVLEIAKNRLFGVMDELCGLYYETKCRRFVDVQGVIPAYAWEAAPVQQTMSFEQSASLTQRNDEKTDGMPFDAMSDDAPPF